MRRLFMSDGRILKVWREGREQPPRLIQLPDDAQASYLTLAEMKKIVREDASYTDVRNFAFDRVFRSAKTIGDQINIAFDFCQNTIAYKEEDSGLETIADLWSACYSLGFKGDCAIKCVALATLLCYLNFKPRFIALQQIPGADYFNHVFVEIVTNGKLLSLDPTYPETKIGDELPGVTRLMSPIFDER